MNVRRRLSSLSNVLITLAEHDFDVVVVTSEPGCSKWKRDWEGLKWKGIGLGTMGEEGYSTLS